MRPKAKNKYRIVLSREDKIINADRHIARKKFTYFYNGSCLSEQSIVAKFRNKAIVAIIKENKNNE